MCHGVQLHVLDRRTYQTVRTGLCLIETVAQLYKEFAFLTPPKEGQRHFFDLLTGTDQVRTLINNRQPLTSLFVQWEDQQAKFRALSEPFRLY